MITAAALRIAEGLVWGHANLKSQDFRQPSDIHPHAEAWAIHIGVARHEHDLTSIQPRHSVLPWLKIRQGDEVAALLALDIRIAAKQREVRPKQILSGIWLANDHDELARVISGVCF